MAAGAHIQINQAVNPVPTGTNDVARIDLRVGQLIHFIGDSSSGQTSPAFTVLAYPAGSSRAAATNPNSYDASFTPDVPGSYLIQFNVGDGVGSNTKTLVFACTADANGIVYDASQREPAFQEALGHDNTASNDRGWAKAYEASLAAHMPRIANHATLLNARAAKHKQIYLAGFYTDRDGGEGPFYWDGASTATHIAGMVVQPGNGTAGAMSAGRWIRNYSGRTVHGHWFGMKPSDITFNNQTPFAALKTYAAANGCEGEVNGKTYTFWDTFVPATQATFDTSAAIVWNAHEVVWGVKDQTVFAFRCPAVSGAGGDPSIPAQIPAIPFTLTPIARSTAYGFGSNVYSHGHSYTAIVGGTSSASAGAEPSGVFSGGVVDGTVTWRYNDLPYRGGAAVSMSRDCVGAVLGNIIFDGLCTWVDNTTDPPGYADYTLPNPGGPTCPLMYAQPRYDQAIYAYGWDVHHKGIWTGIPITPSQTNQDRNRLIDCTLRNFRGESFYGDGQDGNNPHTTWEIIRTTFTESVVGISSSSGIKVYNCRFNHLDQAFDTARGLSDFEVAFSFIEDCRIGIQSEQGLQTQAKPGMSYIHHCVFRNCYTGGVRWGASFGGTFAPAVREFRLEDCVFFDCGWGASAIQVGADVGALNAAGVKILNNTVHVGSLTAPSRTGSQVGTIVGNGLSLAGIFLDLEVAYNRTIVDDIAVTNGKKFDAAMAWLVNNLSNVDKISVHHNNFDFSDTGVRLVPPTTTTDQVFGLWEKNNVFVTGRTLPNVLQQDNTGIYAPGDSIFPKMPEWKVVGSAGNVITAIPTISHPERWAAGQIVRFANGSAGNPVLIAESSATHRLKGPRLFPGTSPDHLVELILIRGSSDPQTNTPIWYEQDYRTIGTREEPEAQEISPSFALVESFAPAIQMWSCHVTHLAPGSTTNFDNVVNGQDESQIKVYFNNHTVFKHNSGAGAVKLFMFDGADFAPTGDGEIRFEVDDTGAFEIAGSRRVGTTIFGSVPTSRTLTGTAPIRVDGDNAAHDFSANRTISIDPTAYAARSTTLTGGTGIFIAGDHAAHDLSTNRTIAIDPSQVIAATRTLTAGAGLTGGGDLSADRTFDVAANADGSIVVNANDVQVGVLATDAQHGARGGGTQHPVATTSVAGFMSAADKVKVDTLSAGAGVPATRTLTAGAGLTGGGDLSADRTFDVVANVDGSIVVNANDVKVGVLATDVQHGVRGGGTQHAIATTTVPGFMSEVDKTKLDTMVGATQLKAPVDAVATVNQATVSGTAQTIDGVTLNTVGQRVLLTAQTSPQARGIWVIQSGAWTRPVDFATGSDAASALVVVQRGTVNADTMWLCISDSPAAVDLAALGWKQFPEAGNGLTSTGPTLNIAANADGSIVVNANDVQVGVLATDAQHGARGGGTQHPVATTSVAGFMSAADKVKSDSLVTSAVVAKSMFSSSNQSDVSFVVQDLGDLGITVGAGETWIFDWRLQFTCSDVATGIAAGAVWPSAAFNDVELELDQTFGAGVVTEREILGSNLGTSGALAVFTTAQDLVATAGYLHVRLHLKVGVTGGSVHPIFRNGANTGGTTTVLIGSYLVANRVS